MAAWTLRALVEAYLKHDLPGKRGTVPAVPLVDLDGAPSAAELL
jgi:hypothetical protein